MDNMTSDERKAQLGWMDNSDPANNDVSSDELWTPYQWTADSIWPKPVMYF